MICPICKINDPKNQTAEFCVQCGSDMKVHHLIKKVREELQKQNQQTVNPNKGLNEKKSPWSIIFQILPSVLILGGVIFVGIIGLRVLTVLDGIKSQHTTVSNKWSEAGFTQLVKMNDIIKDELNLIMSQRREIQILRKQINQMQFTQTFIDKRLDQRYLEILK